MASASNGMNNNGIASMLDTLDLIGGEINNGYPGNNAQKTASSMLIEERKKSKRALAVDNTFSFRPTQLPSPTGGKPLLEQISSSTVGQPKYWASGGSQHNKRGKAEKAASGSNNKGKIKGENYNSRYKEKLTAKASKAKMKNKLKST
eukprot:gene9495-10489_t